MILQLCDEVKAVMGLKPIIFFAVVAEPRVSIRMVDVDALTESTGPRGL